MNPEEFHVRQDQNHMATTFEFLVRCPATEVERAEQLLGQAHALIETLEEELSEYRNTGPVYRLNHAPPGKIVNLAESTALLLQKSFSISALTRKAFNPLAKSASPGDLHFSVQTQTATRTQETTHLSFGAIGKGYALDRVSQLLDAANFTRYLLSAGGSSVILRGFASEGKAWDFAWSWKKDQDGNSLGVKFAHQPGEKIALGISGTHEQGEHLIGVSGKSSSLLKSALVAHPFAADADALSTALFVSGWNEGSTFLAQGNAVAAAVIDESEVPHWSKGFQTLWGSVASQALLIFFGVLTHAHFALAAAELEDSVDLSSLEAPSFTPYVIERDGRWVILPLFMLAFTLLHLIHVRRKTFKTKMKETT